MRAILGAALHLLWGYSGKSSYWYIILMFVRPKFCQTLNNPPKSFSVSSGWCPEASKAWALPHCPQTRRSEGYAFSPHCPPQTGTDSLMENIKLSLGFMCLLPNKFILDQTTLPAYAQDKMFKWCKVGFSNSDPEHFFFFLTHLHVI